MVYESPKAKNRFVFRAITLTLYRIRRKTVKGLPNWYFLSKSQVEGLIFNEDERICYDYQRKSPLTNLAIIITDVDYILAGIRDLPDLILSQKPDVTAL
jgi:hypothetical protein